MKVVFTQTEIEELVVVELKAQGFVQTDIVGINWDTTTGDLKIDISRKKVLSVEGADSLKKSPR